MPGLELVIRDLRGDTPVEEKFRHDGGIAEFVEFLAHDEPVTDVVRLQGTDSFVETVPLLDDKGHMTPQEVERELGVDIAVRWGSGYDTELRSFVNVIATPKGGTHVSGFEQAITKTFNDVMRSAKALRVGDTDVIKDDVLEGLTAVVTVRQAEPQFEGQTKEILGTPQVRSSVRKVVSAELKRFLTSTKRAEKAQARLVMEKVVAASKTRIAARQHKETQRRKTALESSALPAKLRDCRATDNERTELFIVEGDSALGTAKDARNSEFQALLPIRGKILNVQKASVGDMLKNAECASIIQVIGAGSGRTFDLDAVRYGRIIFMADADSDGAHIRCLLATLFFKYMPGLIESGRVFSAVPPLHRIEVTKPKKGMDKYVYTYSDVELQRRLAELEQEGRPLEGPRPALQGPRRDGRRPAGRDHHGPPPPHPAQAHRRRRRRGRPGLRAADGLRRRAAQGVPGPGRLRRRRRGARRLTPYVGDLGDVAWSILRQPNVWVAFALLCVGSMTQFSRTAKAARWPRDRVYAGRAAAAALSLALAVTLARATAGLSVDWRGCESRHRTAARRRRGDAEPGDARAVGAGRGVRRTPLLAGPPHRRGGLAADRADPGTARQRHLRQRRPGAQRLRCRARRRPRCGAGKRLRGRPGADAGPALVTPSTAVSR